MADGTTEVTGGNVVGLAVDTGVSAGIGALFGKVTDVIGEKVLNKLGEPITDKLCITGRNSWTSLYKQVDTKIHNGTWKLSSLSVKTWFKSIHHFFCIIRHIITYIFTSILNRIF